VGSSKGFREKAFGSLSIAGGDQQELARAPLSIHRAIEVHPGPFDYHVRLIDAPGISCCFEVESAPFLQFWSIMLHPTVDRRVVYLESPFAHYLFEISVTQRVA
jgi:hypothetical protein